MEKIYIPPIAHEEEKHKLEENLTINGLVINRFKKILFTYDNFVMLRNLIFFMNTKLRKY